MKARKTEFSDGLNTAAELPQWLVEQLQQHWSEEEILAFGRSINQPAPLDIRVNTLKGKRDKVLPLLQAESADAEATPYSPWGIRLKNKVALNKHELFLDGTLEVQDEGSQLLALLVGAFDIAEKRLANLKPRMTRAGLTNIHPERISSEHDARIARLAGKADRVLVDAPCSGLGTLRRNPDLKYRQSAETVANLLEQQHSILDAASKLVKPQGRLVYATCSVLPEENELQVERFLSEHPEFELVNCAELLQSLKIDLDTGKYLRLNSGEHQTDGFFAAILQRK